MGPILLLAELLLFARISALSRIAYGRVFDDSYGIDSYLGIGNNMRIAIFVAALWLFGCSSAPTPRETSSAFAVPNRISSEYYYWSCADFPSYHQNEKPELYIGRPKTDAHPRGFIHLVGEGDLSVSPQLAKYTLQGLERVWRWGWVMIDDELGEYQYSFIMDSSGLGRYYDFSQVSNDVSVKPSNIYKCVRRN